MRTLIVGNHPLRDNLLEQYQQRGDRVVFTDSVSDVHVDDYDEICLLSPEPRSGDGWDCDQGQVVLLEEIAVAYHPEHHEGRCLRCHVLIHSGVMLQLLQTQEMGQQITEKVDVYLFNLDNVWGGGILLDREPVTIHSERTVHLVVVGWSSFSESVVLNAARVAHYPNYLRNNQLRTRITIISDADMSEFISSNHILFDNSYYRILRNDFKDYEFHAPGTTVNGEITDIEWEFIVTSLYNKVVEEKLQLWSRIGDKQMLTVVVAHDNYEQNMREALHVAGITGEGECGLYCRTANATLWKHACSGDLMTRIQPIGMRDSGYDINTPIVTMAKTVNLVYQEISRESTVGRSPLLRDVTSVAWIDIQERDKAWDELPAIHRQSSICHAMSIPTKMRSVGIRDNEWSHFYDLSMQDIEVMAKVEHNRWCVAQLLMGFRPCTADERAAIDGDISKKAVYKQKRVHYDLCSYDMLTFDAGGVHATAYDLRLCASMPVIVKSVATEHGETT